MNVTTPDIRNHPERKIVGVRLQMCYAENRTGELWKSFMPRRQEVPDLSSTDLLSVQIYPVNFFTAFSPARMFEKWAALEVTANSQPPNGMDTMVIPAGQYAVFHFRGSSSKGMQVFQYIFNTWLPDSGYRVDDRPHFELLGPSYKNNDPSSEEEIWIPVRKM